MARDSLGRLIPFTPKKYITSSNHIEYYNKIKVLLAYGNQDSIMEAFQILTNLFYFDSVLYSKNKLQKELSIIAKENYKYYFSMLIGKWTFKWSGSNWGTDNTSTNTNATIVFTPSEALFFKNDSLIRKTKYLITNQYSSQHFKETNYQLYFIDNKSLWDFYFRSDGEDYLNNLKYDNNKIGLYINEMPNCVCGCPESIYIKEIFKGQNN